MDISETWKKLAQERLERPIDGDLRMGDNSRHPVEKLKRNYFVKTAMMIFFLLCFIALFFLFDQAIIKLTVGILVVSYGIFLISSFSMYKSIRSDLPIDGSLNDVLTRTKVEIEQGLRFEMRASMLVFPFAGVAGYLMGYTVVGADVSRIFDEAEQVVIFIGTVLLFTVIGYFAGRRLTYTGYGRSLEELGRMIDDLRKN
jgi:hypothetical protein